VRGGEVWRLGVDGSARVVFQSKEHGPYALAVGLDRFEPTLREELSQVKLGRGLFKAVRGEYGTGKTFFARWLQEQALRQGFAVSEVQVSEVDTPLRVLASGVLGGVLLLVLAYRNPQPSGNFSRSAA
jgi:hypothetical protein